MTFETWFAFAIASAFVVLIPGPNIVLTVNYAVRDGRRSGLATVPGVVAGAFVAMTLSLAGAGALLATSALLFSMLKLMGAFYLIYLAYALWIAPVDQPVKGKDVSTCGLRGLFWQSFLVSVLNPKGPAFYVSFVPQFVNTNAPVFEQFALLTLTFLAVATLNSLFWLVFASSMRAQFQKPAAMRLLNRMGAGCLLVAGAFTLRATRTA